MGDKVGENPAALRAAVFLLSSKNLRGGGGGVQTPPPPAGRGLTISFKLANESGFLAPTVDWWRTLSVPRVERSNTVRFCFDICGVQKKTESLNT